MKKITALLLIGTLTFAIAGCGSDSSDSTAETPAVEDVADTQQTDAADAAEDTQAAEAVAITGDVMTYEEYIAADLETAVVIETYVQAKQGWWDNKATVYTQDEDGAYFIYSMVCSEEDYELLVPGTKIKVAGYKSEWAGEIEIAEGAVFEIVDDGDTFIADAFDVTKLLGSDGLINHQNEFVSFTGMTVEAAGQDDDGNDVAFLYNWDGSGSDGDDLYFNVSYEGETYTFTVESYLCGAGTDVYEAVKTLNIGDTVDMEGFLYWYEGVNPHITSVTVQ